MTLPALPPHPLKGIAFVVSAVMCFALLDTTSQYVSPLVPVLMAVWLRYVVQTLMTTALLWPQQGRQLLQMHSPLRHLGRGLLMLMSSATAYVALAHVPVGEFTAIMMLIPLAVTILAARLLREKVPGITWVLVALGMAGAFIVIRPKGSDFHGALLLPLLLVLINAVYQILTSHMVRTEDPGAMHFYTGLIGLAGSTLVLPWAWEPIANPWLWGAVALLGIFGSLGHYLLIQAYHHSPASRLTPYMYAQIAFATLAGWLVFGHTPDRWTLIGIAMIATAGVLGARLKHQ